MDGSALRLWRLDLTDRRVGHHRRNDHRSRRLRLQADHHPLLRIFGRDERPWLNAHQGRAQVRIQEVSRGSGSGFGVLDGVRESRVQKRLAHFGRACIGVCGQVERGRAGLKGI